VYNVIAPSVALVRDGDRYIALKLTKAIQPATVTTLVALMSWKLHVSGSTGVTNVYFVGQ